MSYTDVYHDYIQDVPMNVGRKFFPTPNIVVEDIQLPSLVNFAKITYDFSAELRARKQFEAQNEPEPAKPPPVRRSPNPIETSAAVKSNPVLSQEVLIPCPMPIQSTIPLTKPRTVVNTTPTNHFHDFEAQMSVFDDVEISALDDRKVLQEVLMSQSTQSSSSSPILLNSTSINNNLEKKTSLPQLNTQQTHVVDHNAKKERSREEELRKRLLTKGYRADIVEACLMKVPRNRTIHIEYYMKGIRTIEKTGRCHINDAIDFLLKANLMDKQTVIQYSDSSAQLIGMGFDNNQVFDALISTNGDHSQALNTILSANH